MTCAKTQVACKIETPCDEVFIGTNLCNMPQQACPRDPDEGYEKCKTICQQVGHAEEVALAHAKEFASGSTVTLYGHDHYCRSCQNKLFDANVLCLQRSSFPAERFSWTISEDSGDPSYDYEFATLDELIDYFDKHFAERLEFEDCDKEVHEIDVMFVQYDENDEFEVIHSFYHEFEYTKEKSDFEEHNTYWNLL